MGMVCETPAREQLAGVGWEPVRSRRSYLYIFYEIMPPAAAPVCPVLPPIICLRWSECWDSATASIRRWFSISMVDDIQKGRRQGAGTTG